MVISTEKSTASTLKFCRACRKRFFFSFSFLCAEWGKGGVKREVPIYAPSPMPSICRSSRILRRRKYILQNVRGVSEGVGGRVSGRKYGKGGPRNWISSVDAIFPFIC